MEIKEELSLEDIDKLLLQEEELNLTSDIKQQISESYEFLKEFSKEKVIYGINTGFGPMAQWKIEEKDLEKLQYNIVRSHSTGAGNPLPSIYVRAALLSRIMTFIKGHSGVHTNSVELLIQFFNNKIYPIIPEHGSVGASGDLVQLAHLALALIGEGEVSYLGKIMKSSDVLEQLDLKPLKMYIREGLALTNGTAVMTGIGLVNLLLAKKLIHWSLMASVMMNEIASSYDDFMSEVLNGLKLHKGQKRVAEQMRKISSGSKRLRNRTEELYHPQEKNVFQYKVQPYYSLRCIPQILGPIYDEWENAKTVLIDELNSVDDNPIVDKDHNTVLHGGNFHGDYVSFEMDKLKISITKLTMLTERQMNYLFHDRINGILPPFVNLGKLGLNYGLQASQFTATSTTAECQTLSNPMYIHSIPNNNDNQDIVSMGTNSALLCAHVIENSYQVMAIHMMALVQAVDCLQIAEDLAPETRSLYNQIRNIVPSFAEDTPKYEEIRKLVTFLKQ